MTAIAFIAVFAGSLTLLLCWGIAVLPRENRQFLFVAPVRKNADGQWRAVNFTYYGLFNAIAYTLAAFVLIVLMASTGADGVEMSIVGAAMLAICMPASRIVAGLVEKNFNRFTVGGASFVGTLVAPWVIVLVKAIGVDSSLSPMVVMASLAIAYAIGEGTGRLACLSFGCCYGQPLAAAPTVVRILVGRRHTTFRGKMKKACYAGHLEQRPLVPVQAFTAILYSATATVGMVLFVCGRFAAAFLTCLVVTQGWRFLSEFLRSDDRGDGRVSTYQKMSLIAIAYGFGCAYFMTGIPSPRCTIAAGLWFIWRAPTLVALQTLWLAAFVYTGVSTVTTSKVRFSLVKSRI